MCYRGLPKDVQALADEKFSILFTWTSHAWLRRGELIVDITADQFQDAPRPIIIEENSHWHRQFESEVLHKANVTVVSGPGVYDVLRFYARISRTRATGAAT